jgi:hypothetical protein
MVLCRSSVCDGGRRRQFFRKEIEKLPSMNNRRDFLFMSIIRQ